MDFREATTRDICQLRKLEQCVVEAEKPYNTLIKERDVFYYDIEGLISSEDALLLVAEAGEEIVATGYVKIQKSKPSLTHEKHGYLGFMYVSPSHRGQGLNAMLIEELIRWGQRRNICNFYLDVYSHNIAAVKAYEKVGFQSSMTEMKITTAP